MTAVSEPVTEWTTGALVLARDRSRARAQQTELGMSEVGGCQRRAGYRLAGTPATDEGGSLQAAMGTAIHDGMVVVFHELQAAGVLPAADLVEHEVRFAGVLGHLDRYDSVLFAVEDTKTTTERWLVKVKANGPPRTARWQVNLYAAALIVAGYRVDRVVLDYVARDTGEEYRWTSRPDPGEVRDALAWIADVRGAELDMLPREYEPDGPFCRHCPFFTTCWDVANGPVDRDVRSVLLREDPDAAGWAAKLDDARQRKADATADEKEAKGALDALRPNDDFGVALVDVGYDRVLQFRVKRNDRLDADAVRADYRKAGAEPPMKVGAPAIELQLVARPQNAGVSS